MGAEPISLGSQQARTPAPAPRSAHDTAATLQPGTVAVAESPARARSRSTGSLSQRMLVIAATWLLLLLSLGGVALDRTMTGLATRNFDDQLGYMLTAMVASVEIGPDGEVFFNRPLGDQRFLEPNSGLYWQISGKGHEDFLSRSLWDRSLKLSSDHFDSQPHAFDSAQGSEDPLRVIERSVILPNSPVQWRFAVAASRTDLNAQITRIRSILLWSFVILALGLFLMTALQTWYGLSPLRRVRRAIAALRTGEGRTGGASRVTEPLPDEVQPLVEELNLLLEHADRQAEEARTHAGNLAHALKTPLTVVMNAATAHAPDLADTVIREAGVMRRQVDHHLARARAVGRRVAGHSRSVVWDSAEAVERAVTRLYPQARLDLDGSKTACVAIERQDLDEILGNLIENAAKYGGGSVFVTIDAQSGDAEQTDKRFCDIWIEDDGVGIPEAERTRIFARGARLDTGKPGTGLGLAIVRDVAEIYGGSVSLGESEDMGGLQVTLRLPRSSGETVFRVSAGRDS